MGIFSRPNQSNTPTSSESKPSENAAANQQTLNETATKVEGPDGMTFWTSKKEGK